MLDCVRRHNGALRYRDLLVRQMVQMKNKIGTLLMEAGRELQQTAAAQDRLLPRTAPKIRSTQVTAAFRRRILVPLVALSLEEIPDSSEDQPHGVADQGSYRNEYYGCADAERADDVQGFDKMDPQNKVDDGLSETKRNHKSPEKMPRANQSTEG